MRQIPVLAASARRSAILFAVAALILSSAKGWAHGEIVGGGEQNVRSILEGPGGKYRVELMHSPSLPVAGEPVHIELKVVRLLAKPDPLLGSEAPLSQAPQGSVLDASSQRIIDSGLPMHSEGEAGIFGVGKVGASGEEEPYRFPQSGQLVLRFLIPTDAGEPLAADFPVTVKTNVAAFFRRWVNFAVSILILGLTAMQLRKVRARGGQRAEVLRSLAVGAACLAVALVGINFFVIDRVLALREPKVFGAPAQTVAANEDGSFTIPKQIQQELGIVLVPAKQMILEQSFSAAGAVEPRADLKADVYAPLWGRIEFAGKPLAVGDPVKKGQTLVYVVLELSQVERGPMEAKDQDIKGALAKVKDRRDAARREYERAQMLVKTNPAYEQDVQWAKQVLDEANDAYQIIAKQDQDFQGTMKFRDPRKTPVAAPISGTIASVDFTPGELNLNGEFRKMFTIVDTGNVWVRGLVFLSDAGKLKVGQEVLVRPTSGSGKAAAGAVRYIDDSIDAANRTLSILVDVANPEQQFLLGAYVKMDFPLSRRKALAVPEEAVVDDGTTQRVYVAREQETFEPLAVQLGAKQDGWWQVVSGLEEGSLVVSKGAALLGSLPRPESEEASGVATSLDSRPSSDLIPAAR